MSDISTPCRTISETDALKIEAAYMRMTLLQISARARLGFELCKDGAVTQTCLSIFDSIAAMSERGTADGPIEQKILGGWK